MADLLTLNWTASKGCDNNSHSATWHCSSHKYITYIFICEPGLSFKCFLPHSIEFIPLRRLFSVFALSRHCIQFAVHKHYGTHKIWGTVFGGRLFENCQRSRVHLTFSSWCFCSRLWYCRSWCPSLWFDSYKTWMINVVPQSGLKTARSVSATLNTAEGQFF